MITTLAIINAVPGLLDQVRAVENLRAQAHALNWTNAQFNDLINGLQDQSEQSFDWVLREARRRILAKGTRQFETREQMEDRS